jgi:hypothetical protein
MVIQYRLVPAVVTKRPEILYHYCSFNNAGHGSVLILNNTVTVLYIYMRETTLWSFNGKFLKTSSSSRAELSHLKRLWKYEYSQIYTNIISIIEQKYTLITWKCRTYVYVAIFVHNKLEKIKIYLSHLKKNWIGNYIYTTLTSIIK